MELSGSLISLIFSEAIDTNNLDFAKMAMEYWKTLRNNSKKSQVIWEVTNRYINSGNSPEFFSILVNVYPDETLQTLQGFLMTKGRYEFLDIIMQKMRQVSISSILSNMNTGIKNNRQELSEKLSKQLLRKDLRFLDIKGNSALDHAIKVAKQRYQRSVRHGKKPTPSYGEVLNILEQTKKIGSQIHL